MKTRTVRSPGRNSAPLPRGQDIAVGTAADQIQDLSKFAPVVDQVQGLQLGGLADYLRGKTPTPGPEEGA